MKNTHKEKDLFVRIIKEDFVYFPMIYVLTLMEYLFIYYVAKINFKTKNYALFFWGVKRLEMFYINIYIN